MKPVINPKWQKVPNSIFEKDNPQDGTIPEWAKLNSIQSIEAYASSVDKLLKDKIESGKRSLKTIPPVFEATCNHLSIKIAAFEELLSELKNLKPL